MGLLPERRSRLIGPFLGAGAVLLFIALIVALNGALAGGESEPVTVLSAQSRTTRPVSAPVSVASVHSPSQTGEGATNRLIDGDSKTLWTHNVSETPVAVFDFSTDNAFTEVAFENPPEGAAFARHARIRFVELLFAASAQRITAELPDTPGRHRVLIPNIQSSQVTVRVLSFYPGQAVESQEAIDELAVAEVTFRAIANALP